MIRVVTVFLFYHKRTVKRYLTGTCLVTALSVIVQVLEILKGPYNRCDSNLQLNDYQAMHSLVLTLIGLKVIAISDVLSIISFVVGYY